MTEQEFLKQVWRAHDKIVTSDGIPGKVIGVSFTTKSVRALVSGAPEWVRCEIIGSHTTGNDKGADDASIIEELHNKLMRQDEEVSRLREEKKLLVDKISRNYVGDLLRAVNIMQQGLREKKHKMEQVESALQQIEETIEKIK